MTNLQHVLSLSYGKDSIVVPEICKRHGLPLDRIVHVEIMATPKISADLPPMVEFKKKADKIIKERYGIDVEHIKPEKSYEELFYTTRKNGANKGQIYGFPNSRCNWCNSMMKIKTLNQFNKPDVVQYVGICADEPERLRRLKGNIYSPAAEFGYTEADCRKLAGELNLLSPIYENLARGGCWFCYNRAVSELRELYHEYPKYWELLLKWDTDSKYTFKRDGRTVHDYDNRFKFEDSHGFKDGRLIDGKSFRWKMIGG